MLWRGREGSGNVEDRRGMSGGGMAVGGGIGGIIIYLLYSFLGGNPSNAPDLLPGQRQETQGKQYDARSAGADDTLAQFVSVVLKDTEDVWENMMNGYKKPKLVLFSDAVQSACGSASAAVGPFYCPGDEKVYIDLSFFRELKQRFGAPGDFAMAYVIAHEVGHHVQNLLGTSDQVHSLQQRSGEKEGNRLSVKLELQADFYAGVWAHHANEMKSMLEPGDINEALTAANAIGDDRLQQQSQGQVVPDAFTHGTSAQRMYWFKKGFETGDLKQGDTFNSSELQ
ncbi:neutral zinc metallopeptidase [Segetibacter sp.]|jgi:predicted metalloprotease|uniref:KPN_02809 family neutral zinc metallopeptidase n=1 Tax=Segetibacter sp. TaxID=2231182 RepID=UPI0026381591|nr:neutral zinc metallopeptidase [Segetibacter sp.]MCW3081855.1 metalloprotease [Segetibacter sp.]